MGLSGVRVSLFGLFTMTVLVTGHEDKRPLVEIKYGKLRGITLPVNECSRTVDAFFGIPFAKPPVGSLRFASPEPPASWDSVREASEYPPMCLQKIDLLVALTAIYKTPFKLPPVSEDCLFLNVFTPSDRDPKKALPVMMFIHGGVLLVGGASIFDGSALSVLENVVVVSMQYRLGLLGFLRTGDGKLKGNYGLLDQVAALKWIQGSIDKFGGDPNSVTIFGESAGGVSTSALMLSPLSENLFHRAISESGVITMGFLVVSNDENLKPYGDIVAASSKCNVTTLADCLKGKSEKELQAVVTTMGLLPLPITVDGVFLPKSGADIYAAKGNHRVPYLIGVNNQECGWLIPKVMNLTLLLKELPSNLVNEALANPFLALNPSAISIVIDEYQAATDDASKNRDRVLDIYGDIVFVMPALTVAKWHRDSGLPVYFYEFQHRPSMFDDVKPSYVKADHTDELISVLGGPFLRAGIVLAGDATDEEKTLSRTMMKYWANFARHGDPNGLGLVPWPRYDSNEHYLEINVNQKGSKKLKRKKYKFWTETVPEHTQPAG